MKILFLQISNRPQTLQFITMPLNFLGRTIEYNIRIKDRYKDFYELISPSILWIYYFTQRSKRQKYNTTFNRKRKRTSGWRSERVSAQETNGECIIMTHSNCWRWKQERWVSVGRELSSLCCRGYHCSSVLVTCARMHTHAAPVWERFW